jgi:hypothetical protein
LDSFTFVGDSGFVLDKKKYRHLTRRISLLFFAVLTFLMLIKPIIPLIEYQVNKDFISKVLCINKQELNCKGSCHLVEQLKHVNENAEEPNARISIDLEEYLMPFACSFSPQVRFNFSLNSPTKNSTFILKEYQGKTPTPPPQLFC